MTSAVFSSTSAGRTRTPVRTARSPRSATRHYSLSSHAIQVSSPVAGVASRAPSRAFLAADFSFTRRCSSVDHSLGLHLLVLPVAQLHRRQLESGNAAAVEPVRRRRGSVLAQFTLAALFAAHDPHWPRRRIFTASRPAAGSLPAAPRWLWRLCARDCGVAQSLGGARHGGLLPVLERRIRRSRAHDVRPCVRARALDLLGEHSRGRRS